MKKSRLNHYYDIPKVFQRIDPILEKYYVSDDERAEQIINKYVQIETKYKYKLHYKLKWWLDILISDLKQNDDGLIIIVAPEGAGKTVFASQIADYCSNKLKTSYGIDNVHFDGQSNIDKSLASPKFTINHLDESRRALNKMRAISGGNVEFMNFLSECRSQNQLHIIVLPAFTDLEQYVAIHRVKLLISLEKKRDPITKKLIRGDFKVHITKSKQQLKEQWDRKYNEFTSNLTSFSGKFENVFCLDEKTYNEKKEQAKKERYMESDQDDSPGQPKKLKAITKSKLITSLDKEGLNPKEIYNKLEKMGRNPDMAYILKITRK